MRKKVPCRPVEIGRRTSNASTGSPTSSRCGRWTCRNTLPADAVNGRPTWRSPWTTLLRRITRDETNKTDQFDRLRPRHCSSPGPVDRGPEPTRHQCGPAGHDGAGGPGPLGDDGVRGGACRAGLVGRHDSGGVQQRLHRAPPAPTSSPTWAGAGTCRSGRSGPTYRAAIFAWHLQTRFPTPRTIPCRSATSPWSFLRAAQATSSFRWNDVDVDWQDGQLIHVRIVPTAEIEAQPANTPATGVPTVSGTARVGEALTANTSGICGRGRAGQCFLPLPVDTRR